jgi:hypothetical protein
MFVFRDRLRDYPVVCFPVPALPNHHGDELAQGVLTAQAFKVSRNLEGFFCNTVKVTFSHGWEAAALPFRGLTKRSAQAD